MNPIDRQRHPADTADISASEKRYSHWGRPISWVTVFVMIAGFIVGGVALTQGPAWPVVIVGAVIFLAGMLVAYLIRIDRDTGVTEEPLRYHDDSIPHGEHSLGEDMDRGSRAR